MNIHKYILIRLIMPIVFSMLFIACGGTGDESASSINPVLNIADTTVSEGNTGTNFMNFRVSLSTAASDDVTFEYTTSDGSATTADNDYVGATSATATIPAGQIELNINILVNGDSDDEGDESLTVSLSNVSANVDVGDLSAIGIIVNDDATLNISNSSIIEGDSGTSIMTFVVSLSDAIDSDVSFDYATVDGNAFVSDNDYVEIPTTSATIPAGDTQISLNVIINGDKDYEPDETFTLKLSNLSTNVTAGILEGVGSINNDDTSVSFCTPSTGIPLSTRPGSLPNTLWSQTFGREFEIGNAKAVQQTSDGGYIITGDIPEESSGNLHLVKFDGNGILEWTFKFDGFESAVGENVQITDDGGYIFAGLNGQELLVVRTDQNGVPVWIRTMNSEFGTIDSLVGASIVQIFDVNGSADGFIVATNPGVYNSADASWDYDAWLMRLDESGNTVWTSSFGGSLRDHIWSILQASDGGYLLVGQTESLSSNLFSGWIMHINSDGDQEWSQVIENGDWIEFNEIKRTIDCGYILTGAQRVESGNIIFPYHSDALLTRLDSSGQILWSRTYDFAEIDVGYSVDETLDGGFILAGYTTHYELDGFSVLVSERDLSLVRTDENGDVYWQDKIGVPDNNERAYSVIQSLDGGFIVTGSTSLNAVGFSDAWIFRIAPEL